MELQVDLGVVLLLGKDLYTQDRGMVFLRECMQNSLDAGSTRIDVRMIGGEYGSHPITIEVEDDGCGIADYEKFFLTIGGSTKQKEAGSIGGFGIAKLAIIAMDDWKVYSKDGFIEREMLFSALNKDDSVSYPGCKVVGHLEGGWYGAKRKMVNYLKMIDTDCHIFFNGEEIQPYKTSVCVFSGKEGEYRLKKIFDENGEVIDDDHIWVRLNGLPQYPKHYFQPGHEACYLYDVKTDKLAYDEEYPLMPNREEFKSSSESSLFHNTYMAFTNQIALEMKIQEINDLNARIVNGYVWLNGVDEAFWSDSANSRIFYKFKEYCEYIINMRPDLFPRDRYMFGMTDEDIVKGQYLKTEIDGNEVIALLINPVTVDGGNGHILSVALHEVTHTQYSSHYDSFADLNTELTGQLFTDMLTGKFVL